MAIAMFGAGCFWHVEAAFRKVAGVTDTTVGYAGGFTVNPSYDEVCSGATGHAEVVRVEYDPERVSYDDLLNVFWGIHDPTTPNRQGPDVGEQYRSVIFCHTVEQMDLATASKERVAAAKRYQAPIVTEILPAPTFYPAEEYHQQYLEKRGIESCDV